MTRAKRYGIKINLVVCSAGTGVERLQVEIPIHWPIQWLRWEMRIELGRQQWGFWLRKHYLRYCEVRKNFGTNNAWVMGKRKYGPKAPSPGAWQGLNGCFPSNYWSHDTAPQLPETTYMAAWDVGHSGAALMWLSRHPNTKTCHHGFPWGKHEDNLWKTQLGVIALPWIWHMILIEWLSLLSFEPSSVRETKPCVLNVHGLCEVHKVL